MKNSTPKKERIESLDWLRGLLAVAVMIFHLGQWYIQEAPSSSFIGKVEVYAVPGFFVLSGLSMAVVYNAYIKNFRTSVSFFLKRIFRIWPLFAVIVLLTAWYYRDAYWHADLIFLNVTTLFGFIDNSKNIPTGSWSIGNEMVYYALTPILIMAYNYRKSLGNWLWLLTVVIGAYMSVVRLHTTIDLSTQWDVYINPFTNLFFFTSGLAIYYNLGGRKIHPILTLWLLYLSLSALILYPVSGDRIGLVTGLNRLLFSFGTIFVVWLFYSSRVKVPKLIGIPLSVLGMATYGVYLIHPVVFQYGLPILEAQGLTRLGFTVTGGENYRYLAMITTVLVALASYYTYEAFFTNLGKKVTNKLTQRV